MTRIRQSFFHFFPLQPGWDSQQALLWSFITAGQRCCNAPPRFVRGGRGKRGRGGKGRKVSQASPLCPTPSFCALTPSSPSPLINLAADSLCNAAWRNPACMLFFFVGVGGWKGTGAARGNRSSSGIILTSVSQRGSERRSGTRLEFTSCVS